MERLQNPSIKEYGGRMKKISREKTSRKIQDGKAMCNCCNLSYWQGGVMGGLSIVLEKKDRDVDDDICIDIPLRELPKLRKVINKILKEKK